MSSVNKAIIVGRLGQDPEVRYTRNGDAVCNLSVATSRRWTDNQGEQRESTEWHRVVVWGNQAEQCGEYLSKGRLVYVEGRLQTNKWTDDQGNDRYTTEIRAYTVQFLGSRGDVEEPAGRPAKNPAGDKPDPKPKSQSGGGKSEPDTTNEPSGGGSGGGGDDVDPADPAQEPMEKSDFFNRPS